MSSDRLAKQMAFIAEMDKLKGVLRQTLTEGGRRLENSAEHSWHAALMAVLLTEYADESVDLCRVIKMLLMHDVIEIDAGDTFAYDEAANRTRAARERVAAERLFGLLPADQGRELRELWEEFEAAATPDARFAAAMDRVQGLLLNYMTQGTQWRKHGVSSERVRWRMAQVSNASQRLHEHVQALIQDAVSKGYLEA